ncbi:hypothetical protein D9M73_187580 [compost metagenome]
MIWQVWVDAHHLAFAAVIASSSCLTILSRQSFRKVWAMVTVVCISASLKRVFCMSSNGLPNTLRSLVYLMVSSSARSMAPRAFIAMNMRSSGRCCISWTKPLPSSVPSRLVTGTRTSSKNSSEVSWPFWPILSRIRPRRKPGRSLTSRTIIEMPLARWLGSVLQTSRIRSAR